MKARLALVLSASLGLAACQADGLTPPASSSDGADAVQENLLTLAPDAGLSSLERERLSDIRGRPTSRDVRVARLAEGAPAMLREGHTVRMSLTDGLQVAARGESVSRRAAEDVSWAGPLEGREGWVQMVMMDEGITATVTVDNTLYNIEPIGRGLHAVSRIDMSSFPPDHPADYPGGSLSDAIGDAVGAFQARQKDDGDVSIAAATTIRVMVVYTASAASATSISSKIQLAFDEANQSYANSGVNISLTKAHTAQVTYNEAGASYSTHVNRLKGTSDGYMDNVHSLRNTYTADVVVLVVNDSEACGIAAAIKATSTSAFAVAHYSCITGYYSFAHEIGHLQGARHDRYVDSSTSPYAYGHGFIPAAKNWRTVMAYGNNCGNCTRINYWSNPGRTYGGVAMGTTTYEDNARVLNNTATTVAGFR